MKAAFKQRRKRGFDDKTSALPLTKKKSTAVILSEPDTSDNESVLSIKEDIRSKVIKWVKNKDDKAVTLKENIQFHQRVLIHIR
jgi:hypothetical protein